MKVSKLHRNVLLHQYKEIEKVSHNFVWQWRHKYWEVINCFLETYKYTCLPTNKYINKLKLINNNYYVCVSYGGGGGLKEEEIPWGNRPRQYDYIDIILYMYIQPCFNPFILPSQGKNEWTKHLSCGFIYIFLTIAIHLVKVPLRISWLPKHPYGEAKRI